ncbi:MAG: hypothetical protein ACRDTT_16390 [Pseudonocardiaceae bacterium]
MGSRRNVDVDSFPVQGTHLGKDVVVCFNYDTTTRLPGRIVRNDNEHPWVTIIALDDGRYVLSTECMYSTAEGRNPHGT